jgi:uncharacterized protein YbaP (TraB family)
MKSFGLFCVMCFAGMLPAQMPAPVVKPLALGIQVEAVPAMWQVKGVHGTVYLLGTVHMMRPEVHWKTAKIKDAFKSSDVLYLEIADIDPDSVQKMAPTMMQLGVDMEHPLSTKISKEDIDLLDAAVKKMGVPGESALEPMKPWLVYVTLSVMPMLQSGYDPTAGIDQALLADAKAQSKPVKGFETAEQQLHYLADFPEDQQVTMLHQELIDLPRSTAETDDIVSAWTHGNVEKLASMDNDEMKTKYPALYEKLLVKRNQSFADTLTALLKDPATGTVFVGIGAGHLTGPDSVIKMLGARGFTGSRVE